MRGFKSFGSRKVVVPFDRGLTVITGPNGSGKSNILDSIRFVLGDLSARSMRANAMADIIYDRPSGVKGAQSAHIVIQFDNENRRIPVDTDTVSVSREVGVEGASVYRLNGKQVSRSQLVDILSVAGISSSGYNMVMQGTITRLADITPEERRGWIEDLVGISEYDAKKAEAQSQLQQADINLRVASARIDEVQSRLEGLERERNQALRYNFIQSEIRRLQAVLTSYKFSSLQHDLRELEAELQRKVAEAEGLKQQRDKLQLEREGVDSERRRFDEQVADKGSVRLVEIQKAMGDVGSKMASLKAEREAETMGLKRLARIRDERLQQLTSLEASVQESTKNLNKVKRERDGLRQALDEKTKIHEQVSAKLVEIKQSLEASAVKLREIEISQEGLRRELVRLDTKLNESGARDRVVDENLKSLEERRSNFEVTLKSLGDHFKELQKLRQEEAQSLTKTSEAIPKVLTRKETLIRELEEALKTAQTARGTIIEFSTQKSFAEKVAAEENALLRVEELGEVGAIPGIHGRLANIIRVSAQYRKAMEAASSGWLKAVVVEDMETALKCAESLKRMKIGRIKLIPLKEAAKAKPAEPLDIDGVIGNAASFAKCDEKYLPAVNFIFGDTIITSSEKSAYISSRAGYRAVDLNGDLYEAGGGIESGYYRAPIDMSSVLPREETIDSLDKSIKALEKMLEKRRSDTETVDEEMEHLKEEKMQRSHIVEMLEREAITVSQNVKRARQNILTLNRRIIRLQKYLENGRELNSTLLAEKERVKNKLLALRSEWNSIKAATKPVMMARLEREQTELTLEIGEVQRRLIKLESEAAFLESNLENTLKPELERTKADLSTMNRQISALHDSIKNAEAALDETAKKLAELETSRDSLSEAIVSVKDERRKFEEQLGRIDTHLKQMTNKYYPISDEAHRLELAVNTKKVELKHVEDELRSLGFTEPVRATFEEAKEVEATLSLVRLELERLGSVNQLAIQQYDEQKDNYKQLSIRRNELEGEKRTILQFMEEVERKKREAFMNAFEQINGNFKTTFLSITGGGSGWLQSQNPEDPFSGGVDLFVQFPDKAARLISGASGGEKSVAAVSFIFAIQKLSPAPFYVFDEIDAHLDPYYAERLADLLKEQSATSQFIVITLRDVVVDRSERLFGVYLHDGVSSIVSLKLAEAVA